MTHNQSQSGAPNPGAESETNASSSPESLTRRTFVNRLRKAAVVAPLAVAAIASLPKAQAY